MRKKRIALAVCLVLLLITGIWVALYVIGFLA